MRGPPRRTSVLQLSPSSSFDLICFYLFFDRGWVAGRSGHRRNPAPPDRHNTTERETPTPKTQTPAADNIHHGPRIIKKEKQRETFSARPTKNKPCGGHINAPFQPPTTKEPTTNNNDRTTTTKHVADRDHIQPNYHQTTGEQQHYRAGSPRPDPYASRHLRETRAPERTASHFSQRAIPPPRATDDRSANHRLPIPIWAFRFKPFWAFPVWEFLDL